MTDVAMPKPRAGYRLIGYGPRTGQPRDASGRIILDGRYEPIGKAAPEQFAESANSPPPAPARVSRGAARPTQGDLL